MDLLEEASGAPILSHTGQNALEQEGMGWDFPGGAVVKNLPANAVDSGSSPGLGRSHMLQSN